MSRRYLALGLVATLLGCGGDAAKPVAPIAPTAQVAPATSVAPPTAPGAGIPAPAEAAAVDAGPPAMDPKACAGDMPPPDFLANNIGDTPMSGLGEIVASTKTATDGTTPPPTTGYVHFRFEVRVLRWFSGTGPERLVLTQGAEAGSRIPEKGRLLFFSACSAPDGTGYEHDVGYFFPVEAVCREKAEELGAAAARRAKARGKRRSVCTAPKK